MLLIIDNYDSFTFNLVQYFQEFQIPLLVRKNDEVIEKDLENSMKGLIISPGPGVPEKAGVCLKVIKNFYKKIPILGVCLGHQAIGIAFGATLVHAPRIMHGKNSLIEHDGRTIFKGIPSPMNAMRYHSFVLKDDLPSCLEMSARASDGCIMAIRHRDYPVEGVQFHPESILTKEGKQIIKNFLVFNKLTSYRSSRA